MQTPRDRLLSALEAWARDSERERVARWRSNPDAIGAGAIAKRHQVLASPRAREWFEEARERGQLEGAELAIATRWLEAAIVAGPRAALHDRIAALDHARIPYDSDHFAAHQLLERALVDPRQAQRDAIVKALEPHFEARATALEQGGADLAGTAAALPWLAAIEPTGDWVEPALLEPARAILRATEDAWAELLERLCHREKLAAHSFADLGFLLRAPAFDSAVDPPRRWRRLAAHLEPLGLAQALSSRARTEPFSGSSLLSGLAVLEAPGDVRVRSGREAGIVSERNALVALGRAVAVTLTHPRAHPLYARPGPGTVGRMLGSTFAHLYCDPRFAEKTLSLRPARMFCERALAVELCELRTLAANQLAREELGTRQFRDAARSHLTDAWQVEASGALASSLALMDGQRPSARLRVARFVAPAHVALRERFDEDFWRNPRLAEIVRGACARGPALSVEAWMAELEVDPAALSPRLRELLG